ncbi:MAG: hypothetical protein AVDCRST_MAG89-5492 [uncultured Gemmatimonadetes bacterium]|uniref:Uncharacterized protein n=1 Tax=uncultured Gemmatimonadota bacterium TaxID=203437 RepID=A0A6J4NE93_9BACT|nr:MAG: hypothetical protein AVDCRST_MAG89-5492 [uncultured Gemmatimonadota bacterium]
MESEHARLARGHHGRLERRLHRLGAGAGQHAAGQPAGRHLGQGAEQVYLDGGRMDIAHPVQKPPSLLLDRADDAWMGVPRARHREGGREIHVHVSVHVAHVGAARLVPEHRKIRRAIGDVGRFVARQLVRKAQRGRPRRRDGDGGKRGSGQRLGHVTRLGGCSQGLREFADGCILRQELRFYTEGTGRHGGGWEDVGAEDRIVSRTSAADENGRRG